MSPDTHAAKSSAMTDNSSDGLDLRITMKAFLCFQFGVVTLLVALGIFHYAYAGIFGEDMLMKISKIFDVDLEDSIPTVFSIFNLMCSSVLLFVLYLHSKNRAERNAFYWLILGVIFLGLSFDEGAGFHERFSGFRQFASFWNVRWTAYGALFSLAVFLFFIPFLWQIERRMAALFILSGAIFLAGTLGFEYLAESVARFSDKDNAKQVLRILEEGFEMYGIAIFNCTLFSRIVAKNIFVVIRSKPSTSAAV